MRIELCKRAIEHEFELLVCVIDRKWSSSFNWLKGLLKSQVSRMRIGRGQRALTFSLLHDV